MKSLVFIAVLAMFNSNAFAVESAATNLVDCQRKSVETISLIQDYYENSASNNQAKLVEFRDRLKEKEADFKKLGCRGLTTIFVNGDPVDADDLLKITLQQVNRRLSK